MLIGQPDQGTLPIWQRLGGADDIATRWWVIGTALRRRTAAGRPSSIRTLSGSRRHWPRQRCTTADDTHGGEMSALLTVRYSDSGSSLPEVATINTRPAPSPSFRPRRGVIVHRCTHRRHPVRKSSGA